MNDEVAVRRLGPDDWQTTRELRLAALKTDERWFGGNYADSAARTEEQWRAWPSDGTVFAALVDAEPVGMVAGIRRADGTAELISMWIAPTGRGRGLATRLIDAVVDWARERGHDELRLMVIPENAAALGAYERYGFTVADTTVDERGHWEMAYKL